MNTFAPIAIIAWIPVTIALFLLLPARRAAVAGAIAGWLILPPITIGFAGLPDYSKTTAISLGILLSTVIFESDRLISFRPRWFDVPMVLWCLCHFVSSISNDLGLYDGLAVLLKSTTIWMFPYLVGRLYLTDSASLRELALGMVIGGMCLIPLCFFEIVMSPQLLNRVYGVQPFLFVRYGSFRPHVFFYTGLELGLWMNVVTLIALWLWRTGQLKRLLGLSGVAVSAALLVTSILCRSTGATVLLIAGASLLWFCRRTKTTLLMWCILLVAPLFYAVRIPNLWAGGGIVPLIKATLGSDRAGSLSWRIENENAFAARALERPAFGWGGWGRNLVYENGQMRGIDSLWIITFGCNGYVGLALMTTALCLPVALFLARFPAALWGSPGAAPVAVIAVILNLFVIDCLLNAMLNAVYIIAAGGLVNIVPVRPPRAAKTASPGTHREGLAVRFRAEGRTAKDQGRFAEAKAAWLRALDLLPVRTTAQRSVDVQATDIEWCECANDLAWLLVNVPDPSVRDVALGLKLAKNATELQPQCKTYWNTLGAAYYRVSDFKAAVAALNRTITVGDEGNAFDHIFLAMAYAELGNQEESRRWLSLAMFEKERDYPGHSELTRFCNEACSVIAAGPDAPAVSLPDEA